MLLCNILGGNIVVRIDNNFNFQAMPSYRDSLTSVNSVQNKI